MQIKVFSKQGIRKATPERKTILIAINDVSDITKSRNYITRDKYTGIVWLYFDDIETEVPGVSFTKEHAKQIIDVVEFHPDIDIYVHCFAGKFTSWHNCCVYPRCIKNLTKMKLGTRRTLNIIGRSYNHGWLPI